MEDAVPQNPGRFMSCARFIVIKSMLLRVARLRARMPALTKRQKRRRFEERYWDNVYKHALAGLGRIRQRQEQAYEQLWAEYAVIVAKETEEMQKISDVSSSSGATLAISCRCF